MRTIKFYTLGCKANQYDTQSLREQFLAAGFQERENHLPAQVCVINTCTVTRNADSDSLGCIRKAIRENPKARIIVTGCLTELDKNRIKEIKGISAIIKNKDKERLVYAIDAKAKGVKRGISRFKGHTRAFLKIQDGCNNFCSYCKVPLVRGRSRSKPLKEISQEALALVNNGYKEIVLTGICLGSYGLDMAPRSNLVKVIRALEKIEGLLRIRLSSIEAKEVTDSLLIAMSRSKKVCRHLHIPLQSGDEEILRRMNRNYSGQEYSNRILKIKKIIPQIAFTTDVVVGFPGETEENFQNTVKVIKKMGPLKVHIFPYSRREGTAAAKEFDKEVSLGIIKERIARLRNITEACASKYTQKFRGKKMQVLIEARVKGSPALWQGHTDNYLNVLVRSNRDLANQVIEAAV